MDPVALRAARERAGLTQHQLARLVGVAGGERVSRWKLGTSEPRPDILVRLARILKVRALELLDVDSGIDLRALRFAAGLSTGDVATVAARAPMRAVAHIAPVQGWLPGRSVFEQGKPIAAHLSFMQALYDDGTLLLGGPARDGMSCMAVLEVPDLATARELAAADPGVVANVLVYDVHEMLTFFDVLADGRSVAASEGVPSGPVAGRGSTSGCALDDRHAR